MTRRLNTDTDRDAADFSFATPHHDRQPAKIHFDDRGNAVYEWQDPRLTQDNKQAERLRARALNYEGLSLVDNEPANEPTIRNEAGLRLGYNPYESGMLAGKQSNKRRSMQELSAWIEMKRRLDLEQQSKKK